MNTIVFDSVFSRFSRIFLTFSVGILPFVNSFAQTIRPPFSYLPDAEVNVPYSFGLFLDNLALATWTLGASTDIDFTPARTGLTLSSAGVIQGTPTSEAGGEIYTIEVLATGALASKTYTLRVWPEGSAPSCPAVREYVLLLDKSGSMSGTKWDVLKECVKNYLPTLNSQMNANDRLTVIFFNGNNASVKVAKTPFGAAWMSNAADIETTIFNEGVNLFDLTPLGDGLRDAIADLNTAPNNTMRSIIVFSDGMQTIGPFLKETNPDRYEVILASPDPDINLNDASDNHLKIFTIGVGAIPGYTDMLRDLAKVDNDYAQADVAVSPELTIFFDRTIPASLRYCTPRFLDHRTGELNGEDVEKREAFKVNKFVDNLTIRVIPDENARLGDEWSLYKDGVEMYISPNWDGNSLIYSIDFPLSFDSGATYINEAGIWEVGLRGLKGGKYSIMALADDDYLQTDMALGKPAATAPAPTANSNPANTGLQYETNAGDEIRVQASLSFIGKPLTTVSQIEAFLLRPGDDLGDLASAADIAAKDLDPAEVGTPLGQAKIDSLMRDSAFIAKLKKTIQPSLMTHVGNGIYATSFDNNTVTGTYRAVVRFKGTLPGGGDFEGWETKCILVDFGEPDDINLNATQVYVNKFGRGGPYTVKFTPTNRFNRKLGPGQTNRIKVQLQPGGPVNVIDNLDGSYTINKTFGPNENPNIQVNVIDSQTPVYSGSLFGFAGRRWYVSAHAGLALPASKFDSVTYKNGYFAEIDLGRMLSRQFYLEAIGGYYNFGSQKSILGGSLYAGFLPSIGNSGFKFNLAVGGGYFKPKNEDGELGVSGRAGIRQQLTAKLDVCLDGAYFYLPDTERAFATVGLGIKYFF